jgi:hypothetical protein
MAVWAAYLVAEMTEADVKIVVGKLFLEFAFYLLPVSFEAVPGHNENSIIL